MSGSNRCCLIGHGADKTADVFLECLCPCKFDTTPKFSRGSQWRWLACQLVADHGLDVFTWWQFRWTCRPGQQWYMAAIEVSLNIGCRLMAPHTITLGAGPVWHSIMQVFQASHCGTGRHRFVHHGAAHRSGIYQETYYAIGSSMCTRWTLSENTMLCP